MSKCIIKLACHALAIAQHVRWDQMLTLTWIRPSARLEVWPIPVAEKVSKSPSTDLSESSDLGLPFSEPLADQAKKLWTLSGTSCTWAASLPCPGALYYTGGPHH